MKFKALLAATLLLPITAGATHFQSLEEAFYASRFNEIQANFEEPIAFYYLTDIDYDGVCELFVFNEDLSMTSAFCCGGGNLSVLANDIRTANLTPNHPIDYLERRKSIERCSPITVGSDCWFGGGVTVCPGVHIGYQEPT